MLSQDEYILCLTSMIDGAMQALMAGHDEVAMVMMKTTITSTWDLTRPDVRMEVVDLTSRLGEIDDAADYIESVAVHIVWAEDGEPLMGFGHGLSRKGDDIRMSNVPERIMDAVGVMIDETIKSLGLDPDDDRLTNLQKLIQAKTEKVIDDEVAEFSSELDSIFETWRGGES